VTRRGQVVLVAAVVVALALVPVLMAYLQLGYHGDVAATGRYTHPTHNAERVLERGVHDVGGRVTGNHSWGRHDVAVTGVREGLDPRLETLRSARVERGTVYRVAFNQSAAAAAFAGGRCPGGKDRQFGPCHAHDGVVVQERAGETHVVAVALDVTVVGERRRVEETVVVWVVGGVSRSW
jgi:hypothetical protein